LIRAPFIGLLFAAGALAGCGGSKTPPSPPGDPVMERHASGGQEALAFEHPEQAVTEYRMALHRAQQRDDIQAITDFGFNLAVAELRVNEPAAALKTARDTEAELSRRGAAPVAALRLAQAVALYRLERPQEADRLAALAETMPDREATARAAFLRGLIADDAGNVAGLRAALSNITGLAGAEHQADAEEISARLALRTGDASGARAQAEHAAALRRDLLDYRSLARCLELEAEAAERVGDKATAADLYLRAGRSAAEQGDTPAAKRWLNRAIAGSRDPALKQAALAALAASDTSSARPSASGSR
jgi:hypothetical protein